METEVESQLEGVLELRAYEASLGVYYASTMSQKYHLGRLRDVFQLIWQSCGYRDVAARTPLELLRAIIMEVGKLTADKKVLRDINMYVAFALTHFSILRTYVEQQPFSFSEGEFKIWLASRYASVAKVNEIAQKILEQNYLLHERQGISLLTCSNGKEACAVLDALRDTTNSLTGVTKAYADFATYLVMSAFTAAKVGFEETVEECTVSQGGSLLAQSEKDVLPLFPDVARLRCWLLATYAEERVDRMINMLVEANSSTRDLGCKELLRGPMTYGELCASFDSLKQNIKTRKRFFGTPWRQIAMEEFLRFMHLCTQRDPSLPSDEEVAQMICIGDAVCPPVLIFEKKLFVETYKQWLVSEGQTEGTARTFVSALYQLKRLKDGGGTALFECKTTQELLAALLQVERNVECWEVFRQGSSASIAYKYFKSFIASHYLVEAPHPSLLQRVREVLVTSYGGRISARLDDFAFEYFQSCQGQGAAEEIIIDKEQWRIVLEAVCVKDNRFAPTYRLPELSLDEALKAELQAYIAEKLEAGSGFVHIDGLLAVFGERYPDNELFVGGEDTTQNALFLYHVLQKRCEGEYEFGEGRGLCWVSEKGTPMDAEEVIECLRLSLNRHVAEYVESTGEPAPRQELYAAFAYAAPQRFRTLLSNGSPALVDVGQDRYVHCCSFGIPTDELEDFHDLMVAKLSIDDVADMTQQEVYEMALQHYPQWFDNNLLSDSLRDIIRTPLCLFKIVKALWQDDDTLVFNRVGVTLREKSDRLSLQKNQFEEFAQSHQQFTLDDLKQLAARHRAGTQIRFDIISRHAVRINAENYVSKEAIVFEVEQVDAYLEEILNDKDVWAISEIPSFMDFPQMEYPWNPFLLQQYLLSFSHKFSLSQASICIEKCTGLIVRKSAGCDTFESALAEYLRGAEFYEQGLEEQTVLEELIARRVIASRRYKKLPSILQQLH